jgi:hypothetical protein
VLGLFGMVTVNHATSVMIGVGNQLHTELDLASAPTTRPEPSDPPRGGPT